MLLPAIFKRFRALIPCVAFYGEGGSATYRVGLARAHPVRRQRHRAPTVRDH
jgi:hypothetical protein